MSSIFWQIRAVADNWDKEIFKNLHHEDFLFIRETELLTRDEHVDNIDRLVKEKDFLIMLRLINKKTKKKHIFFIVRLSFLDY